MAQASTLHVMAQASTLHVLIFAWHPSCLKNSAYFFSITLS